MSFSKRTDCQKGTGWVHLYEDLASALNSYANPALHESLLDLLAEALDACAVDFPIMNSGEELTSIDPFTFFASFNWLYSPEQREMFLAVLSEKLGIEHPQDFSENETGRDRASTEDSKEQESLIRCVAPRIYCGHDFFIKEKELRFFSFHEQHREPEIQLLWNLFSAALSFADTQESASRELFIKAYNDVLAQRVRGSQLITIALHWVRPSIFLPVHERMGTCIGADIDYDSEFFTQTPSAEAYLNYLDDCDKALAQGIFGACINSRIELAYKAWKTTEPLPPSIDEDKTKALLAEVLAKLSLVHTHNDELWRAVHCFQENWDIDAKDFASMLKASLAEHGTLLASSNVFNPYWELMRFALYEPETVQSSFLTLYDTTIPLVIRLRRFEEKMTTLYTRYRDKMVRAFAKRSAHGNYTAIATYLFLRFPDSCYLYSPIRVNALIPKVGYSAIIRVSEPESVQQYYTLCEQIRQYVLMDSELLAQSKKLIIPGQEYADREHHLLVEDIVSYTLKF